MKNAVIYARVSTDRQKEKHTIESQLSLLPEIIKQRGYTQVREPYIDEGISGETIEERPAMKALLADAERKLFDAIFVIDIDRLTRSQLGMDWGRIVFTCRVNKVRIITPSQEYDLNSPEAVLIANMFASFAGYEKTKIVSRFRRGKREKARQGKYFGGEVTYGYQIDENKNYQPVENQLKIVREMFNECIEGRSLEKIQDYLFDKGYPTPQGKHTKWSRSTIRRILTNPMYMGEFHRWKYERVEDMSQLLNHTSKKPLSVRPKEEWIVTQVTPIIDRHTFELAQEALKSRKVLSKRNSKREYLLGGLIYCESCQCKMTGECFTHSGRYESRYYVCSKGRRKHLGVKCPNRSIKADDIENRVWETLKTHLKNPVLLKDALRQSQTEARGSKDDDLDSLTRQLKEKENQEDKILNLYQEGHITKDQFITRKDILKREIETLKNRMEAITNRKKVDTRLKTTIELMRELKADIDSFSYENKRHVLQLLKACVYVSPDYSIEIRGLVDFGRLNEIERLDKAVGIENTAYS